MSMTVIKKQPKSDTDWGNLLARGLGTGLIKKDVGDRAAFQNFIKAYMQGSTAKDVTRMQVEGQKDVAKGQQETNILLRSMIEQGAKERQQEVLQSREKIAMDQQETAVKLKGLDIDAAMDRLDKQLSTTKGIADQTDATKRFVAELGYRAALLKAQLANSKDQSKRISDFNKWFEKTLAQSQGDALGVANLMSMAQKEAKVWGLDVPEIVRNNEGLLNLWGRIGDTYKVVGETAPTAPAGELKRID